MVQQECHLFNDCGDCCQTLSGLHLVPLAPGKATFTVADLEREAERGAYDPTYGGYFLGKRAALKLRKDYQARMGAKFSLREFHERVMSNGIAPWRST